MENAERNQPPTGIAGSDSERRAANRLADALRQRGRAVAVESVSVRISESGVIVLHALLALAGGLLGLKWPLVGAAIVLLTAFSFYADRGLGIPVIGRLIPKRASQNVLSPPPGPAWDEDVAVVLTAGYDLPRNYPVGEWLSERFSGRITTDRLLLLVGMLPVFVALMLGAAQVEGTWVGVIQLIGSAVLLSILAAQADRALATDAEAADADLDATENLLAVLDEAVDESEGDPPVAICFFGAESSSAVGASAFFSEYSATLRTGGTVVINFLNGSSPEKRAARKQPVLLTAKEGDLITLKMNDELGSDSPIKPEPAILRSATAATVARRGGLRATTVIGGDDTIDVGLDLLDRVVEEKL